MHIVPTGTVGGIGQLKGQTTWAGSTGESYDLERFHLAWPPGHWAQVACWAPAACWQRMASWQAKVACLEEVVFLVTEDFLEEGVSWACLVRAASSAPCRALQGKEGTGIPHYAPQVELQIGMLLLDSKSWDLRRDSF